MGQPVDTNKKTLAAVKKPRLSNVPAVSIYAMAAAFDDGARKYGTRNWRESEVTASVFFDAMQRHLNAWYNGEDCAEDSGLHHLAHLLAGAGIVLDSINEGVFVDDRAVAKAPGQLEFQFESAKADGHVTDMTVVLEEFGVGIKQEGDDPSNLNPAYTGFHWTYYYDPETKELYNVFLVDSRVHNFRETITSSNPMAEQHQIEEESPHLTYRTEKSEDKLTKKFIERVLGA